MRLEKGHNILLGLACLAGLIFAGALFSQEVSKIPETPLPAKILRAILNEVSGQLAFNNEVAMAGYEHIRTEEEFKGFFHEAEYLAKKLKDYGVDEVKLENLGKRSQPRRLVGRSGCRALDGPAGRKAIEPARGTPRPDVAQL